MFLLLSLLHQWKVHLYARASHSLITFDSKCCYKHLEDKQLNFEDEQCYHLCLLSLCIIKKLDLFMNYVIHHPLCGIFTHHSSISVCRVCIFEVMSSERRTALE